MNSTEREMFLQSPVGHPPPGVERNLENPHNTAADNRRFTIVLMVLLSGVVIMRTTTKLGVARRLHLEDYFLIIAWLIYMGSMVPLLQLHNLHTGTHAWNITYGELIEMLRYMYQIDLISTINMVFLKASLILQCLRVFCPAGVRGGTFYLLHVLLWANVLFYTAMTLVYIFPCTPIAKAWDITIKGGHCLDMFELRVATAIANTVFDVLIVVIPQKCIWGLKVATRTKVGLSGIFTIGLAAAGCAAVPAVIIDQSKDNPDLPYTIGRVGKWCLLEFFCGFVAACLPSVPMLFGFLRKQPTISSMDAAFRRFIKVSLSRSGPDSQESASYRKSSTRAKERHIITDVEFHDLVVKTQRNSPRSQSETDDEIKEPDYDTLGFITQPPVKSPV